MRRRGRELEGSGRLLSRPSGRDMACPAAEPAPVAPKARKVYSAARAGMTRSGGMLAVLGTRRMLASMKDWRIPSGAVRYEVRATAARKAPAAAAVKMPDGLAMPLSASRVGLGEAMLPGDGMGWDGMENRSLCRLTEEKEMRNVGVIAGALPGWLLYLPSLLLRHQGDRRAAS